MNIGDYRNPGTQTNKLLRLLSDMQPHSPMEIVREVVTPAASTVAAELREALELFGSPYKLPPAEKVVAGDGTVLHFYRLVLRRPVEFGLFDGEGQTRTEPNAAVRDGSYAVRA